MADEGKPQSFTGPKPPNPPKGSAGDNQPKSVVLSDADEKNVPAADSKKPQPSPHIPSPDSVTIRTMKSDLADAEAAPTSSDKKETSTKPQTGSAPAPTSLDTLAPPKRDKAPEFKPPEVQTAPKSIPGNGKPPAESQKTSAKSAKKSRLGRIFMLFIVLIAVIAAGAGAWWWFFLRGGSSPAIDIANNGEVLTAAQALPAEHSLVVRYSISDPLQKAAIKTAWSEVTGSTPTLGGLIAGNPTLLLEDPEVTEFYYVALPGGARFTLVVPITDYTTELFAQQSIVQAVEVGGWYAVHSINLEGYLTALDTAALDTAGGLPALPESAAIQWIPGQSIASDINNTLPASVAANIPSGPISAAFDGTGTRLIFTTNTTTLPSLATADTALTPSAASLYSRIPGGAEYIWAGDNFASDIASNVLPEAINQSVLNEPANASLISQLTGPYAYYTRTGADGFEDLGLITALPPEIEGTLALGDPAIENSLISLVKRITGSDTVPNLAFSDNTHQQVPLRFANIVDNTQALDYALIDGYLLISSSKEGMFTLIDTATGTAAAASASQPWQALLESAPSPVAGEQWVFTRYGHPTLSKFLPPTAFEGHPVWIALKSFGGSTQLQGIVSLGE